VSKIGSQPFGRHISIRGKSEKTNNRRDQLPGARHGGISLQLLQLMLHVIKLPLADWPACAAVPTSLYCVESVVVTNASGARTTLQYVVSGQAPKAEVAATGEVFAPLARIEGGKVKDNAWWSANVPA
jgi:hypothetical protein